MPVISPAGCKPATTGGSSGTFRQRAAYLDIETTGTFWPGLQVTVVGLYDGDHHAPVRPRLQS